MGLSFFTCVCVRVRVWSLVLEVVLESLRQWECVDVMDALSAQSQSSYSSAQVHEGEGLRCEGTREMIDMVRVQTVSFSLSSKGNTAHVQLSEVIIRTDLCCLMLMFLCSDFNIYGV